MDFINFQRRLEKFQKVLSLKQLNSQVKILDPFRVEQSTQVNKKAFIQVK
jgi:hypothetical protein